MTARLTCPEISSETFLLPDRATFGVLGRNGLLDDGFDSLVEFFLLQHVLDLPELFLELQDAPFKLALAAGLG